MKASIRVLLTLAVVITSASAQSQTGDALSIYVVDVEGGNATLFVSPSGESMLIDTGNGGDNAEPYISKEVERFLKLDSSETDDFLRKLKERVVPFDLCRMNN